MIDALISLTPNTTYKQIFVTAKLVSYNYKIFAILLHTFRNITKNTHLFLLNSPPHAKYPPTTTPLLNNAYHALKDAYPVHKAIVVFYAHHNISLILIAIHVLKFVEMVKDMSRCSAMMEIMLVGMDALMIVRLSKDIDVLEEWLEREILVIGMYG